jgi:hypothetical protein
LLLGLRGGGDPGRADTVLAQDQNGLPHFILSERSVAGLLAPELDLGLGFGCQGKVSL